MEAEEIATSIKKEEIGKMDLKGVAILSQTEDGINIINSANYN